MYLSLKNIQKQFNDHLVEIKNELLNESFRKFSIFILNQENQEYQKVNDRINNSKVIIIEKLKTLNECYMFICFEQTIVITSQSDLFLIQLFFNKNKDSEIISLSNDTKELSFYEKSTNKISSFQIKKEENDFFIFIEQFSRNIQFQPLNNDSKADYSLIFTKLKRIISGLLIKKAFKKCSLDRIRKYEQSIENPIERKSIKPKDFIKFQVPIGKNIVQLIYHIEYEQLLVLKLFDDQPEKKESAQKLFEREKSNYSKIQHPFLPQYYGYYETEKDKYMVIEYIRGTSLLDIAKLHLSKDEKMRIIFDIMIIVEYIHDNGFVYRDLKPDNFIIDENKNAVLIDFDRMVKNDTIINKETTKDFFNSIYLAIEIENNSYKKFTFSMDIYSIGLIIFYIFFEKNPRVDYDYAHYNKKCYFNEFPSEFNSLKQICEFCTKMDPNKRPNISRLIDIFYLNMMLNIDYSFSLISHRNFSNDTKFPYWMFIGNYNDTQFLKKNGIFYKENIDIPTIIKREITYSLLASFYGHEVALFKLGQFFYLEKRIYNDINKTIHYFSLAAKKNEPESLNSLGLLYYEGIYIKQDINKAIEYFELSSKLGNPFSDNYLGVIYQEGKYVNRDINKAIKYFEHSANLNYPVSQYNLGMIYYEGKYCERDMKKAIHYLTLSANSNVHNALNILGIIYFEGRYIKQDINKAIHYFSILAKYNNSYAQFFLGLIYYEGKYIARDITKAIQYFKLSSKNNNEYAQHILGIIYRNGEFVPKDENKAKKYFELSANKNYPESLFNCALYYIKENKINEAINYFTLAANKKHPKSLFFLGLIYSDGLRIPIDLNKAIHYFSLSKNYKEVEIESYFNLGKIYLSQFDIDKAISHLMSSANNNDAPSQYFLGIIYLKKIFGVNNINKSIYYFSLAAKQNHSEAQNMLGVIYFEGKYVEKDINKSIHYFTLSANHNNVKSQYNLGIIYFLGDFIKRDIEKAIHYLSLASKHNFSNSNFALGSIYEGNKYGKLNIHKAIHYFTLSANNNNNTEALFHLGEIYLRGKYIKKDIDKVLYYLKLGADKNDKYCEFSLGNIYYFGKDVKKDLEKSIHYFMLSANSNYSYSQFFLGFFYYKGIYFKQDINKSIYYFELSSNQNNPLSQYYLGLIYYEGKHVIQNINKAIQYLSLSAYQDELSAQYKLGEIYYNDKYIPRDIDKSIHYFQLAANSFFDNSNFLLGVIFHQGYFIKKDIKKAIYYYKQDSSLNNQYAKNNLAIIFEYGIDGIDKSIMYSIELLKEAIKQKNCLVSMYNLANIYFYGEYLNIDESINLLVKSFRGGFKPAFDLLLLVIIKKIEGISKLKIEEEIQKYDENYIELSSRLFNFMNYYQLNDLDIYETQYESYKKIDYYYDFNQIPSVSINGIWQNKEKTQKQEIKEYPKIIDGQFYNGFYS